MHHLFFFQLLFLLLNQNQWEMFRSVFRFQPTQIFKSLNTMKFRALSDEWIETNRPNIRCIRVHTTTEMRKKNQSTRRTDIRAHLIWIENVFMNSIITDQINRLSHYLQINRVYISMFKHIYIDIVNCFLNCCIVTLLKQLPRQFDYRYAPVLSAS